MTAILRIEHPVTSHYDHGMIPQLPAEWLAYEYHQEDCHKLVDIARAKPGISTLHEATGGDPSSSTRFRRYIEPYGGVQELLLALRARTGETWGVLALYRGPGQPEFSTEERELSRTVAPHLAEGARRGLLVGEVTEPEQPEAPGLLVLTEAFKPESLTPGVESWLRKLPGRDRAPVNLPRRSVGRRPSAADRHRAGPWRGGVRARALNRRSLDRAPWSSP